ncbi:MAG: peptidylprolyl isomerase [Bryobacteraceae bacterium]|jgi:hypothetical protein
MKICVLIAVAATLGAQAPVSSELPPDTVVMKIGSKNVTAGEIRQILDSAEPALRQAFQTNPTDAIQSLYILDFLSAEGDKLKLAEESPWKEQIEAARMKIVANAMVNHERDGYLVTPEETEAFYKANQSRYEQAKIKVIYIAYKAAMPVGTSPEDVKQAALAALAAAHDPKQRSESDAKALATDIVIKLRGGADFGQMVAQYSEDATSKAVGGDFGTIKGTSTSYPDAIKKAVLALKPGEVSDPVQLPGAYYIIRVDDKTLQSINDVRESIIQEIRQQHLGDYITGLRQRFAPQILKPEFFLQSSPPKK